MDTQPFLPQQIGKVDQTNVTMPTENASDHEPLLKNNDQIIQKGDFNSNEI